MDWNFKFGVLQGAFFLPFLFITILYVPLAVSQSTFLNDPVIEPSSGSLIYGTIKTLNCSVIGNPQPSITWYRGNQTVQTGITTSTFSFGSAARVDSLFTFTVEIVDHQRSIKCKAANSASTNELVVTAVFNVKATSSIVLSGPSIYIINGSDTKIEHVCVATSGFPVPDLTFYLNDTKLIGSVSQNSKNNDNTYNVRSTVKWLPLLGDNGKLLRCEDSVSGNADSMRITVQQATTRREIPSLSIGSFYNGEYGGNVTLVCSVLSAVPQVSSYSWKKSTSSSNDFFVYSPPIGRSTIQTSANSQSLTIFNLQSGDAGRYKCVGTSVIGSGESNTAILSLVGGNTITSNTNSITVSIPASTYAVNIGSSVTLECVVSATPLASSVAWSRNINGSTSGINTANTAKYDGGSVANPSLTINNASLADEGNYSCSATNTVGTAISGDTYLDVVGSIPIVSIQLSQYTVNFGSSVTLVCEVQSSLQVTVVSWEREVNGIYFPINVQTIDSETNNQKYSGVTISSPSLVIFNVKSTDSGNYVCTATNGAGTGRSSPTALQVLGNIPVVSISQPSYSTSQGNSITLVCSVSSSTSTPLISVAWQKIINGIATSVGSDQSKYRGSTTSIPSLTIFNVQQSDAGTYRCTATNNVGTGQSLDTVLSVVGLPVVSVGQSSYSVNYGNPVTLDCSISSPGATVTSVNWRFVSSSGSDTVINIVSIKYSGSTVTTPSLTIFNTDFNDAGNYYCQAVSNVGTGVSNVATLNIIGSIPTVTIDSNRTVETGGSVTLFCTVSSVPGPTSISWQRISGGFVTNINTANSGKYSGGTVSVPSLTIVNAEASDEGYYRCSATNQAGTGQSDTAFLDVTGNLPSVFIGSGSVVVVGGTAQISCTYTGTPSVTSVYWQKGSVTINTAGNPGKYSGGTVNTPSLTITNVDNSDEGNYRCFAVNSIGTGSSQASAFLDVYGAVPSVVIGTGSSVIIGNIATISCSVAGSPSVTDVSWQRVNLDTTVTNLNLLDTSKYQGGTPSNPSLTILNVQSSDEGDYRCLATNSVGTGQSGTVFLDVTGSIPVISVSNPSYSVNYGSSITLQCTVNSVPTATSVYWERNVNGVITTIDTTQSKYSGSLVQSPSLIIFNAEESDQGSYLCNAINSIGRGTSSSIFLTVISNTPTVQVGSQTYSAVVGDSVQIVCSVTSANPPITSIVWEKTTTNGGTVTLNIFNEPRISGGTTSNPSIFISSVQSSDEGTYSCSAVNSVGQGPSVSAYLDINTIPTMLITQYSYNITIGGSVTLECDVTSSPPPNSVSWKRSLSGFVSVIDVTDSKYQGGTVTSPSLFIKNVTLSDQGVYICSATNDAGTGSSPDIYLNVVGSLPYVYVFPTNYVAVLSESITLNCFVNSSLPITSVAWKRAVGSTQTTIIPQGSSKYSGATVNDPALIISSINEYDEGNYYCTSTNAAGTSTSVPVFVDVTGSPPTTSAPLSYPTIIITKTVYTTAAGNTVIFECSVTVANSNLKSISWQKVVNGVSEIVNMSNTQKYSGSTINNPSLTIYNAAHTDTAIYVVSAENVQGAKTVSQPITLTVTGNVPTVSIPTDSYFVNYGSNVLLVCNVNANPALTGLKWQKKVNNVATDVDMSNSQYSGGNKDVPSLTITNADLNDAGNYTCVATNVAGTTTSRETKLTVVTIPPNVNIPDQNYNVIFGNDVTLRCLITNAVPSVTTVYWNKTVNSVSSVINTGGFQTKYTGSSTNYPSLNISNAVLDDSAYYTCSATNLAGTGTSSARYLNVIAYVPTVVIPDASYSVLAGNDLTIPCSISGTPTASNYSWTFTSASTFASQTIWNTNTKYTLTSLFNPSLTILNLAPSDNGTYRCEAYNVAGKGTDSTQVLVTGSVPVVNIQNTQYSVLTGDSITIPCTISSSPSYTSAYWSFQKSNGQSQTITSSSAKYTFQTTSSGISLTVLNSNAADTGTYKCIASNLIGSSQDSALLAISGNKPTVTIAEATWFIEILKNVTLGCSVTALPNATSVQWNKTVNGVSTQLDIAGNTLKYSGGSLASPSLTIIKAQETDEGEYFCIAKNTVGEGSKATFLNVTGGVPVLSIPQSSYSVTKTLNVTIPCSLITSTPPLQSVRWEFKPDFTGAVTNISIGGQFSGATTASLSLKITAANANNQGSYRCVGINAVGEGKSGYTNLMVTGSVPSLPTLSSALVNVVEGNNAQVVCTSTGNPQPTIAWYFNGQIVQQGQTLSLNNVQKSTGGIYTCTASNAVGSVDSTITVNVQYAPINANTQTSYSVIAGQDVTLTCNTDANPASTYSWTNPGGVLIASTQSIIVSTTDTDGFGTYTCAATNPVGSLNVEFLVTKSTTGGSIGASTVASGGLSSGEIAAIVLAILLLVILIIVICFCCFSHGVCGVICGKKESKAAVEPVKEKEVYKEKEVIIPRFHEESIKGKRQPSAVSRKDVDVKVNQNHYREEVVLEKETKKDNDYEIVRYESVAPAATTLGTIVSVPEERREPHPHRLPEIDYTYEEERRKKHRRKKKRRRHQKKESEDVVVETVRRSSPVRYVEEEVVGEVVRASAPVRYVEDAGEDVVVERVIRRNPSPSRFYRPEPEQPVIIETLRRSHSASPNPGRRHIYQDEGEEVIITERSLSRSPSRRRREERYVTEERIVNGDVIHNPDDMDLRAYDGVVVREPRLSRHGSGRYHVESERRRHRNRSRNYDDEDDYGPEVVQGREYMLDK